MNLYDILGVGKTATAADIKAAYRTLAKTAHPDAGGDAERFHAITLANEVLSDPDKRKRYDETGETQAPIDTTRAHALGLISELLAQVMVGDNEPFTTDLIAAMGKAIDGEMDAIDKVVAKHERTLARIAKMRGRFTVRDGDNLLDGMLEAHREHVELALKPIRDRRGALAAAVLLLDDYEFTRDMPQQASGQGVWSMYAQQTMGNATGYNGLGQ